MSDADSIEVARPSAPVPLTDPHELKDATVRDYTRNAGLFGMPTDPAAIERLATADLNLAAAFHRDELPRAVPRKESSEERRERQQRSNDAIKAQTQATVVRDVPQELGPRLDLPPEIGMSEKWLLAKGRMVRVLEGRSAPRYFPDGTPDFKGMTTTCGYPRGAYEFLCNWFSLDCRALFETRRHNPYFGMSHRDASLKFVADTMDICDRSTGLWGSWFTPK